MLLKNYIYLNILFLFGLFLYFISANYSLNISDVFYLFFGLFGTIIPSLLYFNDYIYKDREEEISYKILYLGFFVYGLGNVVWYFNDLFELGISLAFINILFLFQTFSKHFFFKYLIKGQKKSSKSKIFSNIFSINLLILLLAIFLGNSFKLENQISDLYFILESFISIIFIFSIFLGKYSGHIDFNYFGFGNLIWFLADFLFFIEIKTNHYFMGNLSDFIYYIGFYFMLASLLLKNFHFDNFGNFFQKRLNLT